MTIAFIPKLYLDDIPLFIVPDSSGFDAGSATLVSQVITHGSQVKVIHTTDNANRKGMVRFQITLNASDNERENPILLFNKYKEKSSLMLGSVIQILPEVGAGGLVFTNMKLANSLSGDLTMNAAISFNFEGNPAVPLTT